MQKERFLYAIISNILLLKMLRKVKNYNIDCSAFVLFRISMISIHIFFPCIYIQEILRLFL